MRFALILVAFIFIWSTAIGREIISCRELRIPKEFFEKRNGVCADTLTGVTVNAPFGHASQAREIVQWIKAAIIHKFGNPGYMKYEGKYTIIATWQFFEFVVIPDPENDTLKIRVRPRGTSI